MAAIAKIYSGHKALYPQLAAPVKLAPRNESREQA
jgi:hypothetical protein